MRLQPALYVIAGPNGSGKTTFAMRFLPGEAQDCQFVNVDLIAAGISPFDPDGAAIQSGRVFLHRIRDLAAGRADFGFETTLSGLTYATLLGTLRAQGYRITLFFLWLPSVELALKRIAERVARGGHGVSPDVVRRRFGRGLRNLFHVYRDLCDAMVILDNSGDRPRLLARIVGARVEIADASGYARIVKEADTWP